MGLIFTLNFLLFLIATNDSFILKNIEDFKNYYANEVLINSTMKSYLYGAKIVDTSVHHRLSHRVISDNFKLKRQKRLVIKPLDSTNEASFFVKFLLVVDNGVYKNLNSDEKNVNNYCRDLVDITNSYFKPLKVFIHLVDVITWTERNEIEISSSSEQTLNNFMKYKNKWLALHSHDTAFLLTSQNFEKGVGGISSYNMCSRNSSGVVSTKIEMKGAMATRIAHEIGHNFGMEHDEDVDNCKCNSAKCIMTKINNVVEIQHWSNCSESHISESYANGIYACLHNKSEDLSSCGNGIIEHGEECDCGSGSFCNYKCCNPFTCKFRLNAFCATGKCCDLNTCQRKEAGTVCRDAKGKCDLFEYCTGNSEDCPPDEFKRDGEFCDNKESICYKGVCHLPNSQCFDLAANGSECGVNKICVNQRCIEITKEEHKISCPDNCNGNGTCNNGKCHCFDGFTPPLCKDFKKRESIHSSEILTKAESGYVSVILFLVFCVLLFCLSKCLRKGNLTLISKSKENKY